MKFLYNKQFDFVGKQKAFLVVSALLILLSLVLLALPQVGLNLGVDFRGGSELIVAFKDKVTSSEVRSSMERLKFDKLDVQTFGAPEENRFLLRLPSISFLSEDNTKALEASIGKDVAAVERFMWSESGGDIIYVRFKEPAKDEAESKARGEKLVKLVNAANLGSFGVEKVGTKEQPEFKLQLQELQGRIAEHIKSEFGDKFDRTSGIERVETVGPRVGQQLRDKGVQSILLSVLVILIYIAFRFDIRYAPGAVVALLHDVIITLGVYSALQMEVSLPIIAALLAIVGYSLNDTIVIFDRIRENFTLLRDNKIEKVVNISINDSLSRTLLTSVTTLIAVLALYFLAGDLVQQFAFALIVGVIIGTYSSTFVASPILIFMHNWMEERKQFKLSQEQKEAELADTQTQASP